MPLLGEIALIEQNNIQTPEHAGNLHGKPELSRRTCVILLATFCAIYSILVIFFWSEAYVDFGDGNYLYISSRLADGLVLYRDIMAPQPPCHLYAGSFLIRLGRALGNPLYTVRAFSLVVHLFTMLVIFGIAHKIFRKRGEALLAALLYLVIPIGFWWSQGYQSEGLLMLFLLGSFYFYIDLSPRSMIWASLFATLAVFTNMTAVPYVFFANLFLVVRKRRIFPYYFLPMIILGTLGVLFMEIITSGSYLTNVFFNQVGTFPNPGITGQSVFSYALGKIVNEGKDILMWEGGYVLFCMAGLILFLLKGEGEKEVREYIGWYAFFSLCSIVFVSKGGTMEYIFTIGEPFVVIFFAYAMGCFWRDVLDSGKVFKRFEWGDTSRVAAFFTLVFILLANFYIGFFYIRNTLFQENYELSHDKIQRVKEVIESHSKPGDAILSPPYYAFITGRRVVEEYSENYIWTIKYVNEVYVEKQPGEGVEKALAIADELKQKTLPIVLLDMAQTAKIPPIRAAIEQNYKPLNVWNGSHILQTLNPQIGFYVPK